MNILKIKNTIFEDKSFFYLLFLKLHKIITFIFIFLSRSNEPNIFLFLLFLSFLSQDCKQTLPRISWMIHYTPVIWHHMTGKMNPDARGLSLQRSWNWQFYYSFLQVFCITKWKCMLSDKKIYSRDRNHLVLSTGGKARDASLFLVFLWSNVDHNVIFCR